MKRKPKLTKKERRQLVAPLEEPCSRPLEDQLGTGSATVRRGDHPRDRVLRVDLMTDEQLAAVRTRDPDLHDKMLDDELSLQEQLDAEVFKGGEVTRERLKFYSDYRPMIATFVCDACGARAIARVWRSWEIDDAMEVSGLAEREIVRVKALLDEAWADGFAPSVSQFGHDALIEMLGLVGHYHDVRSFRARATVLMGDEGRYWLDDGDGDEPEGDEPNGPA